MNEPAKRLLLGALHRGRIAELDDESRDAGMALVELGYAQHWRTLLGREAVRLTDHGCSVARCIELGR